MARARGLARTSLGPRGQSVGAEPRLQRYRLKGKALFATSVCEERTNASSRATRNLHGARAIVVDRHYGTTPLWRNTAVVARMSRLSPVPVLALPSEGPALERWARGNISHGRRCGRYDARVRGRAANRRGSRGSTRRAPDDASCARELSRPFRFQRQRGMARRTAVARPTKGDRETA